jgi:hypothetical protein
METLISMHPEDKARYQRLRGFVENNIVRKDMLPKLRRFNGGDDQIRFAMPMMMNAAYNAVPENLEMVGAQPIVALGKALPLGASGRGFLENDDF